MAERRRLQPEDIYQIKTVGDAEVSADGRLLVYVVERIDEEQDKALTDIYLCDLQTGTTRRLTNAGKDGSPCFSPDGQRIAFISSRSGKAQIWVLELTGGEAWRLPTEEAVSGPLVWFPDGQQLAYAASVFAKEEGWQPYPGAPAYDGARLAELARRPADEQPKEGKQPNSVKVVTRLRYRGDGVGYFGEKRRQLFVTAVPASAPLAELKPAGRRITNGDFDHNGVAVSPDGRFLVTSCRRTVDADYQLKSDLWLYSVQSGECWWLYDAPGPVGQPAWSPCGDLIAFIGHDNAQNVSTSQDLWFLSIGGWLQQLAAGQPPAPLQSTTARNLTRQLDQAVGPQAGAELRRGGSSAFWANDGYYFILSSRGAGGVYRASLAGELQPLLFDEQQSVSSIAGNGQTLVYVASAPNRPEQLYRWNGQQGEELTTVNHDWLQSVKLGDWERITYPSGDGQLIDGWVIRPVDYQPGQRYPLLLLVHGGPHGAYGPAFMFAGQVFAGLGYAVLFTNPRGSTSYGQQFTAAIDKNWGVLDYADIMAGVDHLIAAGLADPAQLFVHGWSFGGYMTCWLVTQTDRFRAACGGASVSNLLSDYGTSDIIWADEWEYGGQPWRDHVHLLQHSPLRHVEQVVTPLLLLHGESDLRVPISQSEEFYVALRRLGKTAVLVRYPGEYHGLRRPVHRVDRYQRLVAWFEHYRQADAKRS